MHWSIRHILVECFLPAVFPLMPSSAGHGGHEGCTSVAHEVIDILAVGVFKLQVRATTKLFRTATNSQIVPSRIYFATPDFASYLNVGT